MGKRVKDSARAALEERLDGVAHAFESEDFEGALAQAEALLKEAPGQAEALHYRAAALAALGQLEEAAQGYQQALKASPDDLELLLGAADFLICRMGEDREAVEEGLTLCGRGRKQAERAEDVELVYEFLLLEGMGLNQVGECERALASLDAALEHMPRSMDARVERGIVKEAKKRFAKAQALLPEEFPPPVELSEEEFDQALEAAVKALPEHVKGYLDNVTISVEDIPSDEDLMDQSPPLSPSILGVFRGTPVGERSVTNAFDHFPAAIVLYQKNLERFARTREELIEQIGITVMHEVGHLVGLDEDDLWERGLD
jgi:predicted Zn-dependent protease with MMP-like domain